MRIDTLPVLLSSSSPKMVGVIAPAGVHRIGRRLVRVVSADEVPMRETRGTRRNGVAVETS